MSDYLKSIHIRRFRSIDDLSIDLAPVTVFVGENDRGKSNILKAINLFFNGEIVQDSAYDHDRDFSKVSPKRKQKAEEVEITADIKSPHHKGKITWKKYWRASGAHEPSGSGYRANFKKYSKTPAWLEKLNYRYVPATKERAYMEELMRELYRLFSDIIDKDMRAGAGAFIGNIRKQTAKISQEIEDTMDMSSHIALPQDLSDIFTLFNFETGNNIFLDQRGDGIRVRHIPIILNYLADRNNQAKGTVRGNTIWGYEEPENNLEMGAAFDQAEKFLEYSREIQILITTHSPAFYQLIGKKVGKENVKGYYVSQDEDGKTTAVPIDDTCHIDSRMGIMPLVAPYIREEQEKYKNLLNATKNTEWATDKKMIVVEGRFDKEVVDLCIEHICAESNIFVCAAGSCGEVDQILNARKLKCQNHQNVCIGLLDNDISGRELRNRYNNGRASKNRLICLGYSELFCLNQEHKGQVSVNLEHFLPCDYWAHAQNKEWLETSKFVQDQRMGRLLNDSEIIERLKENYEYSDEDILYLCYAVKRDAKEKFRKFVIDKMTQEGIPLQLEKEIKKVVDKLND